MDQKRVIELLNSLIQLDVDAAKTYDQAIPNVSEAGPRSNLEGFRADHLRHIGELSAMVRRLGGVPEPATPDLKGFVLTGFTAIRSAVGTTGALRAMRMNELLTNRTYERALGTPGLPADARDLIRRNLEDEQRHLAWILQHIGESVPA